MRIFRHSLPNNESLQGCSEPLQEPFNLAEQLPPAVDFIETNSDHFLKYNEAHHRVRLRLQGFIANETIRETVLSAADFHKEGYDYKNGAVTILKVTPEEIATNYLNNLPLLATYVAKSVAAQTDQRSKLRAHLNVVTGSAVSDELTNSIKFKLTLCIDELAHDFSLANDAAVAVVSDLAHSARENPQILSDLISFDAASEIDDEISANHGVLQEMLAIDAMDTSMQRMAALLKELQSDDRALIKEFLDYAETNINTTTWRAGALALAAANAYGAGLTNRKAVLMAVRHRWQESDDRIETEYAMFKAKHIRWLERSLKDLAKLDGANRRKGTHFPINDSDFQTVRRLASHILPSKQNDKLSRRSVNVVKLNELAAELIEPQPLPIKGLATTPEGEQFVDLSEGDLLKIAEKYAPGNKKLQSDVLRMFEAICRNPLGIGTKKLQSRPSTGDRVGDVFVKLREFSPKDSQFPATAGRQTKRTRVVYALVPDKKVPENKSITIVDVLLHDKFDDKY